MSDKFCGIVESYLSVHRIGAGTKERSYYSVVAELVNTIARELKPNGICLSDLSDAGAGHPDFGLFSANQVQKGEPRKGQMPERGVIAIKAVADETWLTAEAKSTRQHFSPARGGKSVAFWPPGSQIPKRSLQFEGTCGASPAGRPFC